MASTPSVYSKIFSSIILLSSALTPVDARFSSLQKRAALTTPLNPVTNWTYLGCYTDDVGSRSLGAANFGSADSNTVESCIAFCWSKKFVFAGTEYGSECYCANKLASSASKVDDSSCSMACSGNATEACGSGYRLSVFKSNQTAPADPIVNPGPGNWSSLGCYSDNGNARTLANRVLTPAMTDGTNLTVSLCTSACRANGYSYGGVEYGGECYCDNAIRNSGALIISGCSMACNGNSSEYCGGSNALNLYIYNATRLASSSSTVAAASSSPSKVAAVSSVVSSAAGTSSSFSKAATISSPTSTPTSISSSPVSPSKPPTILSSSPSVSSSSSSSKTTTTLSPTSKVTTPSSISTREVTISWSSSSLKPTTVFSATSSAAASPPKTTTSPSSSSTTSNNTTISSPISTISKLSTTSSLTSRSTTAASSTTSLTSPVVRQEAATTTTGSVSSTQAVSTAAPTCPASDGVVYKTVNGTTFLIECGIDHYGGNLDLVYPASFAACIAACDNNPSCVDVSYVGGPCYLKSSVGDSSTNSGVWGAKLIARATAASSSSIAAVTSTSKSVVSSSAVSVVVSSSKSSAAVTSITSSTRVSASATSSKSSAAAIATGWTYKGCYIDNANGRVLQYQQADNSANTAEACISICKGLGYSVAGTEYGVNCFCDDYIRNGAALTSDSDCNMACPGNNSENCGAGNRMSIYSNSTLKVYQPPAAQNTSLPTSWEYVGCLKDDAVSRTFPYQLILSDNNTANNCLTQCAAFGYPAGGLEYGDECYCGDQYDIDAANATLQSESSCNSVCSGNSSYICGGGNLLSYYRWTGDPLYVWNYPQGNDAGQYQFFIGGVVIPLITTPARNGKVTFVEKFGTGAPNTTGAYELDPSLSDDFSAAWREMHVKTDVFCAAGLTLPDRAARQLMVGGWANDATYGVRLYWPDGSPGVAGTNDWQENVNELSLQTGRWYPSAMVMANGSILVVGGEVGSNGAAVPNMEVLPKPAGGYLVPADYLGVDLYRTYPFLCVLPSGGIFIAYYNEARILDEVTLATKRQLPNIPGAVNDFLGGRSYPFEGTAMLLPQYAPYSDPLRVLICGGSTPGPEIAIDNCVSIAPDDSSGNWTIERMPSKRVIVCMTALPDGTYLILNGAHQGRAGFGTGNDPNMNAVLYDPSKAVGHRMSIMANTTIARMYHSEAVLMDDGRVLVSGSDPEDSRYPQEYRVEVFNPSYILSGATRPTFTLPETDWTYGQTVSFTLGAAASGSVRVSLIGATSSTHGNSMGQRTFFPAVSCSGTSCTVTAPPDKYVCPPSWFQMFVLDGPTPSVAQWVRVGGDPGALGNWPDFADFDVPGVGAPVALTTTTKGTAASGSNATAKKVARSFGDAWADLRMGAGSLRGEREGRLGYY